MSITDPGGPISGGGIIIDPNPPGTLPEEPTTGAAVGPGFVTMRDDLLYSATMNDGLIYFCAMDDGLA